MRLYPIGLAFLVAFGLTACSAVSVPGAAQNSLLSPTTTATHESLPTKIVAPTATPDPQRAIEQSIRETLRKHARAYQNLDLELLKTTIDQTNTTFRRAAQTSFEEYRNSVSAGQGYFRFTLGRIEMLDDGFVKAYVSTPYEVEAQWLFREVDGVWLLSEPSREQIGQKSEIEDEHFIFETYPWDEETNQRIIELMKEAREEAILLLDATPSEKARVEIRPVYAVYPYENVNYIAFYQPNERPNKLDTIIINAPTNYLFGFYDAEYGWEDTIYPILVHEYVHMIHKRNFDNAGYETSWMSEGLASYFDGMDRSYDIQLALEQDALIPIIDTESPVYKQDLMHMQTLQADIGLAYGLAQSLVTYIIEEHGGIEVFWQLARRYDETQKLDIALQDVLGLSYEEFDAAWRLWLEQEYR
jgi:hypothetical protein